MGSPHKKFEKWFSDFTEWICRRKYLTLTVMVLLTAVLASQTPKLTIDTRDEAFFHPDDPALVAYNNFRDMFGTDDIFIIAIKPQGGMSLAFFNTLKTIHEELEASVPYLDEITSLINARIVRAEGDTLVVEGLMDQLPQTDAQLSRTLALIERYPMFDRLLITKDRAMACILIKCQSVIPLSEETLLTGFNEQASSASAQDSDYLSNDQYVKIDAAIHAVIEKYPNDTMDFYLSGTPAFVAEIQRGIEKDLASMTPLSFVVIIFFLFLLFRRFSGVVYPLITVALSLVSSLGIMAWVGLPITNAIAILPTFLIVVGISDSVHILTIYYRIHGRINDKHQAIAQAVGFAGLPVLMTSVTTACGLLSFIWADVALVAQLGYIAPVGVMLAFVYTVVLLPALIAIFPSRSVSPDARIYNRWVNRTFDFIARATTQRPVLVVILSTIVLSGAVYSALSLRFSHNALKWLPPESSIRRSTAILDSANGGTVMLDVAVACDTPDKFKDPALLQRIEEAGEYLLSLNVNNIQAGKVWSMTDIIKEINRALHQDDPAAYALPPIQDLVAQELILFESSGSNDLEEVVDSTYQIGRIAILAPFEDAILYKNYVDKAMDYLQEQFPDESVTLTGHIPIFVEIINRFITSMAKSYGVALVVITLLMVVIIGRLGIGLMSMAANIVPVLCIFGIMGFFGIPLDMVTILIGSLVLGLVVDDTIHFLHHFRKAYDETGDVETAVRETLHTTGRALVITSLVLCGGFFIYTTSFLASNVRFGYLTGCAVILALLADFIVIPALLSLVYGKKGDARNSSEALAATPASD